MKQQENRLKIKYQISNIKTKFQRSKIFEFLFVTLILFILFLNFIYSQLISPIYFKFVNNDKVSVVTFLQKIKTLPEYSRILEMNNNIYGPTVKGEIFAQENKKKELIKNLEQQLTVNPKARDLLYSLYQLTKDKKYLKQTKEIDPGIN